MSILDRLKKLIRPDNSTTSSQSTSTVIERRPPRQLMPLLDAIEPGNLPPEAINQFVTDVNQLIGDYNHHEKESTLKQMQEKMRDIEHQYRPSDLAGSPGYQAAQEKLFQDIKDQFVNLDAQSIQDKQQDPSSLPEIVANMSPEKAKMLLRILRRKKGAPIGEKLTKLYSEEDSPEAKQFRAFLCDHSVSFLGGENSRNFKVEHLQTGKTSVLKVDNRLNMPRSIEVHLRNQKALKDKFIPNDAERQLTVKLKSDKIISRTLLVTKYCHGGDVLSHGQKLENIEERLDKASIIFEQMANIMLDIQDAQCVFPDAKITNWLVDGNENVCIADTKSFLLTDKTGQYSPSIPISGNEYYRLIHTRCYSPPEFSLGSIDSRCIEADSTHAFILGKNLFQYTAGKDGIGNDAEVFDFRGPLFATTKGGKYKALINNLVKPNPGDRMALRDAKDELFMINNPEFSDVLKKLKLLKCAADDPHMNAYIRQKQQEVNHAKTDQDKDNILNEMETMAGDLKADKAAENLRQVVKHYRTNAGKLTIGMNAKANRIEHAMAEVPLDERTHLLSSNKIQGIKEALASHRYLGKRGNVYKKSKNNEVDLKKAATTFKKFHNGFFSPTEKTKKLNEQENNEENKPPKME